MNLSLTHKSVFGRDMYYPACDTSRVICQVGGFKTLTILQIEIMKKSGWQVDIAGYVPA